MANVFAAYTRIVADEILPIATLLTQTGVIMADAQELAGKSRLFKTISFVVYVFLYLIYTMPLAIIFNTIDS